MLWASCNMVCVVSYHLMVFLFRNSCRVFSSCIARSWRYHPFPPLHPVLRIDLEVFVSNFISVVVILQLYRAPRSSASRHWWRTNPTAVDHSGNEHHGWPISNAIRSYHVKVGAIRSCLSLCIYDLSLGAA